VTAPPESFGVGIAVADRGQVQESDASNNFIGISCLSRCLITRNTANNNVVGVSAGGLNTTVSFNTANDNGSIGIFAGEGSLVTRATPDSHISRYNAPAP
jgi:hypothetical protein